MSLDDVLPVLACPHCHAQLTRVDDHSVRCDAGHAFDQAKQGHLNLLGAAQPGNADTIGMIDARLRFLNGEHYAPIADAVAVRLAGARMIVDAGAGPGWYLARFLTDNRRGLALDVSVSAARRAASCHPRAGAVVADTWQQLPIKDQRVDAVTCIFAPKNMPEFARILSPGGILITVTPDGQHLAELRAQAGLMGIDAGKQELLRKQAVGLLEPVGASTIRYPLILNPEQQHDLIAMGPNAFHQHEAPTSALTVTVSVDVAWFRKPSM